jgi:hypothetical protein
MGMNPLTGFEKYSKNPENPRRVIDRDSLAKMFPGRHGALVRVWGSLMWACFMLVL